MGEFQDFLSKNFCLTEPKIPVGEGGILFFRVSKKFEQEWGGEYQDLQSEIFCLTHPKLSVGENFTVAKISGIEKIWIRGGGSNKIFRGKFLVSQCRKIS